MWGTVLIAFVLSLGLFFYVPILLTDLVVGEGEASLLWNAVDGLIRVIMFVAYLWGVSKLPDMKRVFEYHGAEHMSIHAFENGRSLDADGARGYTTLHPRCGTSFLFFVMLISIVVFSFLGRPENVIDRLERLAFVPLIGGLAYEAIKLSGKFAKAWFLQPVIWPGLMMQKITTSPAGRRPAHRGHGGPAGRAHTPKPMTSRNGSTTIIVDRPAAPEADAGAAPEIASDDTPDDTATAMTGTDSATTDTDQDGVSR